MRASARQRTEITRKDADPSRAPACSRRKSRRTRAGACTTQWQTGRPHSAAMQRVAAGRFAQRLAATHCSFCFSVADDRGAGVEARSARWQQCPTARHAQLAAALRTTQPTTDLERAPPHADQRKASQAVADQAQKRVFSVAAAPKATRVSLSAEQCPSQRTTPRPCATVQRSDARIRFATSARARRSAPAQRRGAAAVRKHESLRLCARVRDSYARILHEKQHRLAQMVP